MTEAGRAFADAISFLELAADSNDPARDEFACPFSFADLPQLRSGWRFPWDETPETGGLCPGPMLVAFMRFARNRSPCLHAGRRSRWRFQSVSWPLAPFVLCMCWVRQVCPAASRISREISSGWEISERWLAFTSMVLAPIRLAMKRSRSGLMVRSSVETA